MKINKVYFKRVMIRVPAAEEKTKGGIFVPDSAANLQDQMPVKCEIMGVGPECTGDFKAGEFVLVNKISTLDPRTIVDKENRLSIINEADIFCRVED